MKKRLLIVCCALCSLMACNSKTDTGTTLSGLKKADFDTTVSGKKVALYELKNKNGVEVAITNYGGRIVSIWVPDRNGKFGDIMLAHSSIADYIADQGGNFGALIGRYGNRINQGRFILDGQNTNCLKIITVTAYTEATPISSPDLGCNPTQCPDISPELCFSRRRSGFPER
ncbi:MAG: hypothetical protein ACLTHQ_15170 [Odoribacter splanchnicus]